MTPSQSVDQLLAEVPHVLGFNPHESVVVLPTATVASCARVDVPRTADDRSDVVSALRAGYGTAQPGGAVALMCVTADRRSAELTSQHLASNLAEVGLKIELRLWVDGDRWLDLDTGATGRRTKQAADRVAVTTVLAGAVQPAASRTMLANSLIGDRSEVKDELRAVRHAAVNKDPRCERTWALGRLQQFHADGHRTSNADAARLLVALENVATRDALCEDVRRANSSSHIALWADLTRRAPSMVRAAPAALLGLSAWLRGHGAYGWCAMDQVPEGQFYPMASLVASALQHGLHPTEWEHTGARRDDRPMIRSRGPRTAAVPARHDACLEGSDAPSCAGGSTTEARLRQLFKTSPLTCESIGRIDWIHA